MKAGKDAVFTLKLERQLREDFTEAAARARRTASDVVRELMRDYIKRRHQEENYLKYLRERVDTARVLATDGDFVPPDVAAKFFASLRGETKFEFEE